MKALDALFRITEVTCLLCAIAALCRNQKTDAILMFTIGILCQLGIMGK